VTGTEGCPPQTVTASRMLSEPQLAGVPQEVRLRPVPDAHEGSTPDLKGLRGGDGGGWLCMGIGWDAMR
jgi:hypothetical protein